jgi:hypothetical protein
VLLAQIDRLTERAAVCARLKKLELMHACDRLATGPLNTCRRGSRALADQGPKAVLPRPTGAGRRQNSLSCATWCAALSLQNNSKSTNLRPLPRPQELR